MSITGIIGTLVIGFFAGLIARFLKPGDDSMGIIMTSLLGIAGAFAATFLGRTLGLYQDGQAAGFIGAVVGAIVVLVIYGFIKKAAK
ncbi:GlsB/YeaQ/YmgE family stress response membrane protein [Panacagrimonas sp.]|uniref:GlsB/YeaQ/YmgE family stress response membrane protein n=1 Tax=Panacagrimonas sp. TaxID=2480088 RepID=UPI003B51A480